MLSRRRLLTGTVGAGLALSAGYAQRVAAQSSAADLERNKDVVRRLKESQGTKDEAAVQRELTAPGSKRPARRHRASGEECAGPGLPNPGPNLRTAFPDRRRRDRDHDLGRRSGRHDLSRQRHPPG